MARWVHKLADQAAAVAGGEHGSARNGDYQPNAGLATGRVRRALAELLGHLRSAGSLAETNFRAVLSDDEHREPAGPETMTTADVRELIPGVNDGWEAAEPLVKAVKKIPGFDVQGPLLSALERVRILLDDLGQYVKKFDQGDQKVVKKLFHDLDLKSWPTTTNALVREARSNLRLAPGVVPDRASVRAVKAVAKLTHLACDLVHATEQIPPIQTK